MTAIVDTKRLNSGDTGGQAGTILEPALACSGKRIIVTGNCSVPDPPMVATTGCL